MLELILERHVQANGHEMDPFYQMMITDLVNKISRLAVSPDHMDTIHDIGGYAILYEEVLRETQDVRTT